MRSPGRAARAAPIILALLPWLLAAPADAQPRLRERGAASLADTTFCVSDMALDALIRLRDRDDLQTLPPDCFVGTATFIPEQILPHRETRLRIARSDPEGRESCIRPTTRETRRCTITTERVIFVAGQQTNDEGRRLPRRIYVAVDPRTRLLPRVRLPPG